MFDDKCIDILFRDIHGRRFEVRFQSADAFRNYGWSEFNDEDYEILMVEWGKYCIYNALSNDTINLEDLIGFFA